MITNENPRATHNSHSSGTSGLESPIEIPTGILTTLRHSLKESCSISRPPNLEPGVLFSLRWSKTAFAFASSQQTANSAELEARSPRITNSPFESESSRKLEFIVESGT